MVPLIGKYLLFIMTLITLSTMNAVITLAIYHREECRQGKTMSKWMRRLFVQVLPPFLLLSSQKQHKIQVNKAS